MEKSVSSNSSSSVNYDEALDKFDESEDSENSHESGTQGEMSYPYSLNEGAFYFEPSPIQNPASGSLFSPSRSSSFDKDIDSYWSELDEMEQPYNQQKVGDAVEDNTQSVDYQQIVDELESNPLNSKQLLEKIETVHASQNSEQEEDVQEIQMESLKSTPPVISQSSSTIENGEMKSISSKESMLVEKSILSVGMEISQSTDSQTNMIHSLSSSNQMEYSQSYSETARQESSQLQEIYSVDLESDDENIIEHSQETLLSLPYQYYRGHDENDSNNLMDEVETLYAENKNLLGCGTEEGEREMRQTDPPLDCLAGFMQEGELNACIPENFTKKTEDELRVDDWQTIVPVQSPAWGGAEEVVPAASQSEVESGWENMEVEPAVLCWPPLKQHCDQVINMEVAETTTIEPTLTILHESPAAIQVPSSFVESQDIPKEDCNIEPEKTDLHINSVKLLNTKRNLDFAKESTSELNVSQEMNCEESASKDINDFIKESEIDFQDLFNDDKTLALQELAQVSSGLEDTNLNTNLGEENEGEELLNELIEAGGLNPKDFMGVDDPADDEDLCHVVEQLEHQMEIVVEDITPPPPPPPPQEFDGNNAGSLMPFIVEQQIQQQQHVDLSVIHSYDNPHSNVQIKIVETNTKTPSSVSYGDSNLPRLLSYASEIMPAILNVQNSTSKTSRSIIKTNNPMNSKNSTNENRILESLLQDKKVKIRKRYPRKIKYTCSECNLSFQFKVQLNQHIKIVHSTPVCICPFCKIKFRTKIEFSQHYDSVHRTESTQTCELCNKLLSCKSSLTQHKMNVHFLCRNCGTFCNYKKQLQLHMKSCLKKESLKKCIKNNSIIKYELNNTNQNCLIKIDQEKYDQLIESQKEKQLSKIKKFKKTKCKKYQCTKCGLIFNLFTELRKHIKEKHVQQFPCKLCMKSFSKNHSLKMHILAIHVKINSSSINFLDAVRNSISKTTIHSDNNTSNNVKPIFKCSYCSLEFTSDLLLIRHQNCYHKIIQCEICGKMFSRQYSLTVHIAIIHYNFFKRFDVINSTEEGCFRCLKCNKICYCLSDLVTHDDLHENDDSVIVSDGDKDFNNQNALVNGRDFCIVE